MAGKRFRTPDEPRRHGIIIKTIQPGHQFAVSCICRAVYGKHDRTGRERDYHQPMDNPEGEDLYTVYNNPANHWADFEMRDRIG